MSSIPQTPYQIITEISYIPSIQVQYIFFSKIRVTFHPYIREKCVTKNYPTRKTLRIIKHQKKRVGVFFPRLFHLSPYIDDFPSPNHKHTPKSNLLQEVQSRDTIFGNVYFGWRILNILMIHMNCKNVEFGQKIGDECFVKLWTLNFNIDW